MLVIDREWLLRAARSLLGNGPISGTCGIAESEPRRVFRRLRLLRGWSHGNQENSEELLARGEGASRPNGARAPGRARLAVGGTLLDRGQDRLQRGNPAPLGASART